MSTWAMIAGSLIRAAVGVGGIGSGPEILTSLPGLGVIPGARILGEFGDDPDRYVAPRLPRPTPAPPRSPEPRAPRTSSWPATSATNASTTPPSSGVLLDARLRRRKRTTVRSAPAAPDTKPLCGRSPTGGSASSTAAWRRAPCMSKPGMLGRRLGGNAWTSTLGARPTLDAPVLEPSPCSCSTRSCDNWTTMTAQTSGTGLGQAAAASKLERPQLRQDCTEDADAASQRTRTRHRRRDWSWPTTGVPVVAGDEPPGSDRAAHADAESQQTGTTVLADVLSA